MVYIFEYNNQNRSSENIEKIVELKREAKTIGTSLLILLGVIFTIAIFTSGISTGSNRNLGLGISFFLSAYIMLFIPLICRYYPNIGGVVLVLSPSILFAGLFINPINISIPIFISLIFMSLLLWTMFKFPNTSFLAILVFIILSIALYFLFFRETSNIVNSLSKDTINSSLFQNSFQLVAHFLLCSIPFIFLWKFAKNKSSSDTPQLENKIMSFRHVPIKLMLALSGIGMSVSIFSEYISVFWVKSFNFIGISMKPPEFSNGITPIEVIFSLFTIAIVGPIMEELLFRGAILGRLRKFGDFFAVFLSALLFALFHTNLLQFSYTFIIGLVLGIFVIETNSMLPSILLHIVNNATVTIGSAIIQAYGKDIYYFALTSNVIFVALGIWGLVYILGIKPNFLGTNNHPNGLSTKECLKATFSSFTFLVSIFLTIFLIALSTKV